MDYQTLHLLFRCSKEFSHAKLRSQALSDTECMICSYVRSHEGCSQDSVAAALKADKTTVGKALASLERKQYVSRRQDTADRRIKRLTLTESGRERIAALADLHNGWLTQVMSAALSAEEQAQFENYCERLLTAAERLTKENGGTPA